MARARRAQPWKPCRMDGRMGGWVVLPHASLDAVLAYTVLLLTVRVRGGCTGERTEDTRLRSVG